MDKTRELFHKIANQLNNISLTAGSIKEALKNSSAAGEDIEGVCSKAIDDLGKIENTATSLAGKLEEIKALLKSQR